MLGILILSKKQKEKEEKRYLHSLSRRLVVTEAVALTSLQIVVIHPVADIVTLVKECKRRCKVRENLPK